MKKTICAFLVVVFVAVFNSNVEAVDDANDIGEIINVIGIVDQIGAGNMNAGRLRIVLNAAYDIIKDGNTLLEGSLLINDSNRFEFWISYKDDEGNIFTFHYMGLSASPPQLVERKLIALREKGEASYDERGFEVLKLTESVINYDGVQVGTSKEILIIDQISGDGLYRSEETTTTKGKANFPHGGE